MNRVIAEVRMELLSDTIFSSGNSIPGGEDISLRTDSRGQYYLPGSTLKGLMRESMRNYMCWTGTGSEAELEALMGAEGVEREESARRLVFGNLYPQPGTVSSGIRSFTALDNGVMKPGSLHSAACLRRGTVLTGMILCDRGDWPLVEKSIRLIQWIGLKRSRGFGHVKATATCCGQIPAAAAVAAGNWIRYRLLLRTPMTITAAAADPWDDQRRDHSGGLDYLPGSAVRGMVISWLAQHRPRWFSVHREQLLNQVVFRNALPLDGKQQTIPTPLGYYEDREQGRFYSVLDQDAEAGHKRANLAPFFRLGPDGDMIQYTPPMERLLRIAPAQTRSDRRMFTAESISAGNLLEGYIYLPDPSLAPVLAEAFRKWVWLGADRYAGCGLCSVELLDNTPPDDSAFGYRSGDAIPDTLYMLVLSPTAMTDHGEVCGLTDVNLSEILGVEARIERCATALRKHSGFNRTWGCASPVVSMYAPGSIFRIRCSGAPSPDRLRAAERMGIGMRRTEGCGQILFLRDFGKIRVGEQSDPISPAAAADSRYRQARCRWMLRNQFPGGPSPSLKGRLRSLCESIMAQEQDMQALDAFFFRYTGEKNGDGKETLRSVQRIFDAVLATPLEQTLACPGHPDSPQMRLRLLCEWVNLAQKEDKR